MELVDFRVLGTGKHSVVYLAKDRELGRDVAVKIIASWPTADSPLTEFAKIQRLVSQLSQRAQVALVFEAAATPDGGAYIIMEYAEGGTAATLLRQSTRVAPDQVNTIGFAAAQALATAHAEHVLHQALSPENMLIDGDGMVKVSDFGIAAVLAASEAHSVAHNEHVAPEVVGGGSPTEASDVYALGSTLYTLLEGRSPLRRTKRDRQETIDNRKRAGMSPKPLTHGSPQLQALVHSALAVEPSARPTAFKLAQEMAPCAMSAPERPDAQLRASSIGPIVCLPFFDELIAQADAAKVAKTLEPLHNAYSRSVAEVIAFRHSRGRRRRVQLALLGVGAAASVVAAISLLGNNGEPVLSTASGVTSTAPTKTDPSATNTTSSTVLVASEAPPIPPLVTASEESSTSTTVASSTTTTSANQQQGVTTVPLVLSPPAPAPTTPPTATSIATLGLGRFIPPTTVRPAVTTPPVTTPPVPQPTVVVVAQPPVPATLAPAATAPPTDPPPTTAPPTVAPQTTQAPAPPVVNPPLVGAISARSLGGGDASFVAPNADRCADSRWAVNGPVNFTQSNGWMLAPPGCWSTAHQFDTTWGNYPDLVSGHYTITLTVRKDGVTSASSTGFDMP